MKKTRVEDTTTSGGAEFPLVPFLRRLNQIPTPHSHYSIPIKPELVHIHIFKHVYSNAVVASEFLIRGLSLVISPMV